MKNLCVVDSVIAVKLKANHVPSLIWMKIISKKLYLPFIGTYIYE